MRKYEEISERIMQRGDEIIESRKNRAVRIKHISYAVSGICAALIVGVGIHHVSALQKPDSYMNGTDPLVVQETTAVTSAASQITTVSVASNTSKTEKTSAAAVTTVTTAVEPTDDTAIETDITEILTEISDVIDEPEVQPTADIQSIFMNSQATLNIKKEKPVKISPINGDHGGNDGENKDNYIVLEYEKDNTLVPESEIGELIQKALIQVNSDDSVIDIDVEVYRIINTSDQKAVAVKLTGTNDYYRFNCNSNMGNMFLW